LSGREVFRAAAAGEALAFAPTLWDEVAQLVRQPAAAWWRDPTAATRILADAATLAGADALVVRVVDAAVDELAALGVLGDDALDGLTGSEPVRRAIELLERLALSDSRAVLAVLPDVAALQRRMGAGDPDVADDAFSDLARASLEAGVDGLAVVGADEGAVLPAGERAGALGAFFGRPVLSAVLDARAPEAWIEWRPDVPVGFLAEDGTWPDQHAGIVLTPGDVSGRWDVDALRVIGSARP
jgi:hypothetical protein